ncbi:hypothetical protein, partial [Vibrio parahaemolyticus]|uniref:hypothetical protein n=1 Tax=Vibrio parahaemolyticus TaxID=670 RepID=UPI00116CC756
MDILAFFQLILVLGCLGMIISSFISMNDLFYKMASALNGYGVAGLAIAPILIFIPCKSSDAAELYRRQILQYGKGFYSGSLYWLYSYILVTSMVCFFNLGRSQA